MQNFLSWAGRIDQQGEERHARRQCGHQYRSQSFKCTANDKVRTKGHAFMQGEVDVVRNLEDAVACRDPGKGHEADHPDINIACTGMLESPSWFSDGGGASVERAADALNRPGIDSKPFGYPAHAWPSPLFVPPSRRGSVGEQPPDVHLLGFDKRQRVATRPRAKSAV